MEVVVKFLRKSTIWVRAYVYDKDGELVDPTTSITVTLVDSAEVKKVDAEAMTPSEEEGEETGVFDYYYNTDADSAEGWWNGEVWTVDGTGETAKNSSAEFSVEVKKGL